MHYLLLRSFFMIYVLCTAAGIQEAFDAREATIDSIHHDLFNGLATCRTVVSAFLSRIEAFNGRINAIISLNPDALAQAEEYDEALSRGNITGSLFCIPILLKDNFDTVDMSTTGGNVAMSASQPLVDAPVVTGLKCAGAVILGKTNLHEFALEGLSVSSLGGQTINPYDHGRTPGGSSGGSGAAVAASFAVFATGSDTVNSLRSPASANGIFSIRPTRGLITRKGIIPISYTQDAIGPIARCVTDVATALTVMAGTGYDPDDNTTALVPQGLRSKDFTASLTSGSLQGLRIGVLEGFFNSTASNETTPVNNALMSMVNRLKAAGSVIVPIQEAIYNASMIASLDVQRFEYREQMDSYLEQKYIGGNHPSSIEELYSGSDFLVIPSQYEYVNTALALSTSNATYSDIKAAITNLTLTLQNTFTANALDFIVYPEQKNLVVKIGSPSQSGRNGILAALTGSPVVTIPAGFSQPTEDAPVGIPIGMELLGRPWSEESLLQTAWQIERLERVRKMPKFAEAIVEIKQYGNVPKVMPDVGNIPAAYPLGVL